MAISRRLQSYLEEEKIPYEVIPHRTVYTAQEVAQATHIPGQDVAKTVMVRKGHELVMVVLPALAQVDLGRLADEMGEKEVRLAREAEFEDIFSDCDLGAMPPFGNLYGIPVYVDEALTEDETITFNGGSHEEAVKISFRDFDEHVSPRVLKVSSVVS